jgi:hypothetical protein
MGAKEWRAAERAFKQASVCQPPPRQKLDLDWIVRQMMERLPAVERANLKVTFGKVREV